MIRLVVVLSHPIQYFAPWFRYIASTSNDVQLRVVYATRLTAEQQGKEFGKSFVWDTPLLEGYEYDVVSDEPSGSALLEVTPRGVDVPRIGEWIKRSDPHVALVQGWYPAVAISAVKACNDLRVPVLYRGDTNLLSAPRGLRRAAWRARTWHMLRRFDAYLSVGARSREMLLRLGAPACRVFSSPHCVDNAFFAGSAANYRSQVGKECLRSQFGIGQDRFLVLFVGKIESKKRLSHLIGAVAKIDKGALLVVGSGPLEENARCEAMRLGVQVAWAGFLNQTEIAKAYVAADCLALVSDTQETWGLVVNEAMATGLPCVVSDSVGCSDDLIEPGTGERVPANDTGALSAALSRVRDKAAAGHDYASACTALIDRYSYRSATTGLIAACEDVALSRRRAGSLN